MRAVVSAVTRPDGPAGGCAPGRGYVVSTPVFEGPFDLLLHLILREEVELWQVSLAGIVDAFVAEVESLPGPDLEVTTEFLLVAATLVQLKTRRLLPRGEEVELDEELGLWEERDLLLARLLECRTFKTAASALQCLADVASRSYPRRAGMEERFAGLVPDLLEGVTPARLQRAYARAVSARPAPRVDTRHLAAVGRSVQEAVQELLEELPVAGRISFRRLTEGLSDRLEVIVRFLALLELYKQGVVDLDQSRTFGELHVAWLGHGADLDAVLVDAYDG
jgi:segregation and condensation protein A